VGRRLSAPLPALDARRVADAIVHAARSPRPTTMVGSVTTVMRLTHLLAPNLAARLLKSAMATNLMRASPAKAKSDGNLHSPRQMLLIEKGVRSRHQASVPLVLDLLQCSTIALAAKARSLPGGGPEVADQTPAFDIIVGWTLVVAHSLSRCTSCALLERSPRAFLREPPVESAVPELHLARKSAVLEKRAFH